MNCTSTNVSLWLFKSLQNERCLDVHFRLNSNLGSILDKLPNYKLIKQVALYNKLHAMYPVFIIASLFVIPIYIFLQFVLSLTLATLFTKKKQVRPVHVIATSNANFDIIRTNCITCLEHDFLEVDYDLYNLKGLSSRIGSKAVCSAFISCVELYRLILRGKCDEITDLLLHCRDTFKLSMLVHYSLKADSAAFITSDHYQRWAFLLSHFSGKLSMVQHGYIDPNIEFLNPYGCVDNLFVYDYSFKEIFEKYYTVNKCQLINSKFILNVNPGSSRSIFLASSFPAIDVELEFISLVVANIDADIIIKLHPRHCYDSRGDILISYASHVCSNNEFPNCRAFVSYNSFLEFNYKTSGVPSFSLSRDGTHSVVKSLIEIFSENI